MKPTTAGKRTATLRLTLDVTFVSDSKEPLDLNHLTENMRDIAERGAGQGLMTQGAAAYVKVWNADVAVIK